MNDKKLKQIIGSVSIVNRVYDPEGICPCERSCQCKDAIKIAVRR